MIKTVFFSSYCKTLTLVCRYFLPFACALGYLNRGMCYDCKEDYLSCQWWHEGDKVYRQNGQCWILLMKYSRGKHDVLTVFVTNWRMQKEKYQMAAAFCSCKTTVRYLQVWKIPDQAFLISVIRADWSTWPIKAGQRLGTHNRNY